MSPLSTARRIAGWAVITAVATTLLVLGGITLVDRYVQAPRSDRIERAVHQSEENGQALAAQAARGCDFYIATADALATLANSPDLTAEQAAAIHRMQQVARTCREETPWTTRPPPASSSSSSASSPLSASSGASSWWPPTTRPPMLWWARWVSRWERSPASSPPEPPGSLAGLMRHLVGRLELRA